MPRRSFANQPFLGGGGGVFGNCAPPVPPQPEPDVVNWPGGTVCTAVETLFGHGNGTLTDGW